ncbi:MAG: hypothetical protein L6R38_008002 [Xanthoria sp. 2 TBL-2021]|nr:MAG: hypothetical protein L6R38_008002 [Xanthoria sp. 2 TBL-2021]
MVNTRGQRPSTAQIDPALDQASLTADLVAAAAITLPADVQAEGEPPATHTRLRKRRRSASPTIDDSARSSKRFNLRNAPSPAAKRISTAVEIDAQSLDNTSARQGVRSSKQDATATVPGEDESRDEAALRRMLQGQSEDASLSGNEDLAAEASPDMHAVMSKIIDHGETIDSQYEARGDTTSGLAHPEHIVPQGASLQLKIQSLPILDNLARQILATFANSSYSEILVITSDNDSEPSQAYSTLKSLFDHTKKVYSIRTPFLSPPVLGLVQPEQAETIRKANLATFVSSVFGSQDVGFYDLDEFFLDTFLADGARLLKNQAGLFLDLKTQAYISAIAHRDRSREDILQDLFPNDIEQRLLDRRSGAKQLGPGEVDFIQRSNNRKKTLLEESMTEEVIAQLPNKYVWDEFLRDISGYVSKNATSIIGLPVNGRKASSQTRSTNHFESEQSQQPKRQALRKQPRGQLSQEPDAAPTTASTNSFVQVAQMVPTPTDNITEKAARAAQFALEDFGVSNESAGHTQNDRQDQQEQQPQHYPFQFEQQPAPYYTHQNQFDNNSQQQLPQPRPEQQEPGEMRSGQGVFMHGHVPYPTQTAPTSVLYERARHAATAKVSPSNKRAGHPSQRRPWSTEEENALMSGLDQVKGPHWSQILALYGPGGTMNETLKDRNQVQLKDKARNLKLFFLKSGIEVPYYLQFVTGELKTRAPQAAKQEQQRNETAARLEEEAANSNAMRDESTQLNDVQQIDGGAEPDTNMEDGEGEVIDPAEYAAVHGGGSHIGAAIQPAIA